MAESRPQCTGAVRWPLLLRFSNRTSSFFTGKMVVLPWILPYIWLLVQLNSAHFPHSCWGPLSTLVLVGAKPSTVVASLLSSLLLPAWSLLWNSKSRASPRSSAWTTTKWRGPGSGSSIAKWSQSTLRERYSFLTVK